jgi:4-aminobutyrate aminotransferase/(S)-3-amino-2-methylpropionate transaminase
MRGRLQRIKDDNPGMVGDVRGLGSMLALELVSDPATRRPWMEATAAVNAATLQRGVITIRAGLFSNCVRFLPPLVISDEQLDAALEVVAESVAEVAASLAPAQV